MVTFSEDKFAELWDGRIQPRVDELMRKHFHPIGRTLDMIGRGIAQLHFRLDDLERRINMDHEAGTK